MIAFVAGLRNVVEPRSQVISITTKIDFEQVAVAQYKAFQIAEVNQLIGGCAISQALIPGFALLGGQTFGVGSRPAVAVSRR